MQRHGWHLGFCWHHLASHRQPKLSRSDDLRTELCLCLELASPGPCDFSQQSLSYPEVSSTVGISSLQLPTINLGALCSDFDPTAHGLASPRTLVQVSRTPSLWHLLCPQNQHHLDKLSGQPERQPGPSGQLQQQNVLKALPFQHSEMSLHCYALQLSDEWGLPFMALACCPTCLNPSNVKQVQTTSLAKCTSSHLSALIAHPGRCRR